MIFYKRMIGDIQAKTGDLSCAEMGIHDRFLTTTIPLKNRYQPTWMSAAASPEL